jgi:signal peptidase II
MNRIPDMRLAERALLVFSVLFSCVGCDQVTKNLARQCLAESEVLSFLNDIFRLQYTENPGGFLSLGADIPENLKYWVFTIFVGFFLAAILVFLIRSRGMSKAQRIAASLLLGGGVGNLVDRIFNEGRVIDFMNLGIGSLRTGVFNVADIAIIVGGVWLFANSIQTLEEKKVV